MSLTPKNWSNFQHYKDRSPPWIKLHRQLIDNIDYHLLSPLAGKCLPLIWILASECDGALPTYDEIGFRLRISADQAKQVLDELYESGFLVSESKTAEQVGTPAQRWAKSNGFGSRHISDAVKRTVWERDGGKCVQCGAAENIEYDHKVPVSKGGNSDETNIQLLCRPCNRSKRTKIATQTLGRRSLERETERQEKTEKESLSEPSSDARKSKRFEYPKDFEEEFWIPYPTDANMSKKEAFDAWKRLAADDRKLAARAVPAFRQYCEKNPDYRPIHANRFLLKRRFDGFAAAPNGRGPPAGLSEEQRAKWVRDQIEAENAKNPRADTEGNPDIGTVLERGDRFRQAQVG
jgi:5-methylcytosine-specific restriction endonuclease McrA